MTTEVAQHCEHVLSSVTIQNHVFPNSKRAQVNKKTQESTLSRHSFPQSHSGNSQIMKKTVGQECQIS